MSPTLFFVLLERLTFAVVVASGFQFELREVNKDDLEEHILAANIDDAVDGIIVYFPVFGSRQVFPPILLLPPSLPHTKLTNPPRTNTSNKSPQ